MSFTQEVKQEIATRELPAYDLRAQSAALVQLCASLRISNQQLELLIKTENANTAKRMFTLLKTLYHVPMKLSVIKKMKLRKNNVYQLHVLANAKAILEDLDVIDGEGLRAHPGEALVADEGAARAYLAGAFLAAGSINSPKKSNYHCEIVTQDEAHARFVQGLMNRFELGAKYIERRHQHVVYLKASEKISDFLRLIQANNAVLDFEDIRIQRDFHNSMTRLDNCEVANNMKTMVAAQEHIHAIQTLIDAERFDDLDDKLKAIAYLRLNHPEASLNDLVSLFRIKTGQNISKSGIKHRLAKLIDLNKN